MGPKGPARSIASRLATPHYALNLLAIATAVPLVVLLTSRGTGHEADATQGATAAYRWLPERGISGSGTRWVRHAVFAAVIGSLYRLWRGATLECVLSAFLRTCQMLTLFLFASLHPGLCSWYLLLYGLLYLLAPQTDPKIRADVEELTQRAFDAITAPDSSGPATFVWLYSSHSPQCHQLYPLFALLSCVYSGPQLHFARLDVSRFPSVAPRLGLDPTSPLWTPGPTLPLFLLYSGGTLLTRWPPPTESYAPFGVFNFGPVLTERLIVRHFQLDMWLMRNRQGGSKAQ